MSQPDQYGEQFGHLLALGFFVVANFFIWRSFYGMRITKAV
jgi:hypothetical protein